MIISTVHPRVEVSSLTIAKRCKICGEFEQKSVSFALNSMNALKKNFQAVKNFFLPLKRWKTIFHRYQQNAVKNYF